MPSASSDLAQMSRFSAVKAAPPVAVFALSQAYKADPDPRKVDLGVGAYRGEDGQPWVLPVVKKVELEIANEMGRSLNHEYLGMCGIDQFTSAAVSMILGSDSPVIAERRAAGVQCLSGTGSLRVGAEFLARNVGLSHFYVSDPTWPNHLAVFRNAGFAHAHTYRYWDPASRSLDAEGMLADLRAAPEGSVVILHVCAHNPTGVDPTEEQWAAIADVCESRRLFPFFDCAYQGFASGNLERDSWALRYFVSRGFELFCAQSFAKNFGLYNERAGNLLVVMNDHDALERSLSQMAVNIRALYSNPPHHGARIVARVLNSPELFAEWLDHIGEMSSRIQRMRHLLKERLVALGTPGDWDHITNQIGMFCYTGLSEAQVAHVVRNHHVYLMKDGRISMCGVTRANVDHVAKAFDDAVRNVPAKL